ncbi:hypothetical protein [Pseudobacteriovorax antillogorgiicola]|uniref:Lipoprotein n=1 Tax=Pseudobacteriovorax antillogorgiicola TaxID=1513793 RepID=A0A1Y6C481_9BACT|nr:hypothetical protein [Pseudobacteriovorax antillogorgiicola]TCS49891.1 hypothetical protein EDD56_114136 [Pseudobacteriovorax antillogorgiicola]SMF44662.1 hypothetical protein SAMN06296036_113141 [Pseudobacteriovorax antillogorgiicola]
MKYLVFTALLAFTSCSHKVPNKRPIDSVFPSVSGKALDNKTWRIPEDLNGKIALLLIGYKQNSQFDIDRWLIGLDMKQASFNIFEIPTVSGWIPSLLSDRIDEGMRSGIPDDIWNVVITVYDDADKIVAFTGNENPLNARVILLSKKGKVIFFHDEGFSVPDLNRLMLEAKEIGAKD